MSFPIKYKGSTDKHKIIKISFCVLHDGFQLWSINYFPSAAHASLPFS